MATYSEMNKEDLQKELEVLKEEYAKICQVTWGKKKTD